MSKTYLGTLEVLAKSPNIKETWKIGLQGRDSVKASRQMRMFIGKYGTLKTIPHPDDRYIALDKKRYLNYYTFNFAPGSVVNKPSNAIKLYNFFFKTVMFPAFEKMVVARADSEILTEKQVIDSAIRQLQERRENLS